MMLLAAAARAFERAALPDAASRLAIAALVGRTGRRLDRAGPATDATFVAGMDDFPIAAHTDRANEQHYELPPEFFALMLGPRRKYSSCFYETPETMLAEAEEAALLLTASHAGLADGQSVLELGCGWGSLSLWMAERYPHARITAVSNAAPQRRHIEAEAQARGLGNLRVVTADMNDFTPDARFDRIVSVEMFEHMANWRALLGRARDWLEPTGALFLHVFTHRSAPYRFDVADRSDWIAQHFFTGGLMPSHGLIEHFPDLFRVEESWRWNGMHYARTARDWLRRLDANHDAAFAILCDAYGRDALLWQRRWRLFLLATEGLFGHDQGRQWGVSHYRLAAADPNKPNGKPR